MDKLLELTEKMMEFDRGDPRRIQHFVKVHAFARHIGLREGLDENTQFILETAALVHDIGVRPAEAKYGRCDGKLQEREGPAPAREMLTALGYAPETVDRVCYLVSRHHTYDPVDGVDHRILLEADLLVNLYEEGTPGEGIHAALGHIFRTKAGMALCRTMFGLEKPEGGGL